MAHRCLLFGIPAACLFLSVPPAPSLQAQDPLERDLAGKAYRSIEPVSGELKVVGSRSMGNLLNHWAEGLKKYHPRFQVDLDCDGSETALPEVASHKEIIGALSRPLAKEEIQAFEKKTGKELVVVEVCDSEIVVIVHPDNPVKELSIPQLHLAFGKQAKEDENRSWGDLGLKGDWATVPLLVQGRDTTSGTRVFFRHALKWPKEIQERSQKENPGNRAIVQAVAAEKGSIGYCPKTLGNKEVKVLKIASEGDFPAPLFKQELFLVTTREKGKTVSPLALEFFAYALSQSGQDCAARDGFQGLGRSEILTGFDRIGFSPVK